MNPDILISVHNLWRYYGHFCAVREVNFEVKRGQILGFLGPNGAGKSTTMQMITGNLAPTIGQITVGGQDLFENPIEAKSQLGYLPEHPPLYQEMQVIEFLKFCAKLHRVPRPQIPQALERAMEHCGLSHVGKRLIGNLSKGYQQRVGIAQAIIHTPSVVILDEPTIGLDPIQIREIRNLISKIGAEHSVILSTHILPEVQAVCNQVQIINQGQLILNDTIQGLLTQMKTTQLIIGLRHPPELTELLQVDGIEEVEQVDSTHFRIRHAAEHSPAEQLVEQSVTAHWGLFELIPEKRSLEQVFVDLTQAEEPHTTDLINKEAA